MPFYIISGLIGLGVIIVSCELFTNSVAWAGIKFRLNRGIPGKILKAAGTALPETILPVIALVMVPGRDGQEISTGAILGTPLMLSTLALGLASAAALLYRAPDKKPADLRTNEKMFANDLIFFSCCMAMALIFSFFSVPVKKSMGFLFLLAYAVYTRVMKRRGRDKYLAKDGELRSLYFSKKESPEGRLVLLQAGVSAFGMASGAVFFVSGIEHVSLALGMTAFVISVLISPLASNIPDVLHTLFGIRNGREAPALSGTGGALVFQGTVMIFAGIMVTDWILCSQAKIAVIFAAVSGLMTAAFIKMEKKINAYMLLACGVFYVLYAVAALKWVE